MDAAESKVDFEWTFHWRFLVDSIVISLDPGTRRYVRLFPLSRSSQPTNQPNQPTISHEILISFSLEDWVRDKIVRVYTHGSPPVAALVPSSSSSSSSMNDNNKKGNVSSRKRDEGKATSTATGSSSGGRDSSSPWACPILEAFDLPSDLVYGYVQPYVRICFGGTAMEPIRKEWLGLTCVLDYRYHSFCAFCCHIEGPHCSFLDGIRSLVSLG